MNELVCVQCKGLATHTISREVIIVLFDTVSPRIIDVPTCDACDENIRGVEKLVFTIEVNDATAKDNAE